MGYSFQRYLVGTNGVLYRVASAFFARMLRDLSGQHMPELAGQRDVELIGRVKRSQCFERPSP